MGVWYQEHVFSEMGNKVICVDIDSKKIEKLNNGIIPIFETGLETIVLKSIKNPIIFDARNQ